ncbi:MAG: hypothetical protein OK442_07725 [Thaumarchaeota archaeon]|nr:hypothetical protein [Nitrososphaerota archaeon]
MNPSKRGIGTAVKAGAVVLLIIIGLGTIYLLPKFMASSQSQGPSPNPGAQPVTGMPSLFYDFTRMSLAVDVNDQADGIVQNSTYSYTVLGKGALNSTVYTRVEFTTVGEGNNIVIWYGLTGGIGEVDVVGVRNYTGNGTVNLPFISTYTQSFGALVSISNNSTLLSLLTKTSEVLTSIGPTDMDVTTYLLPGRSYPYAALTLKLATIPGTTAEFATYLDEKTTDGSSTTLQVTSLTR